MPNSFDFSRDTRAQELIQFFNLKGIPLAPQLLSAILGSIGGNTPGFNSPYSSIGRGMSANRTANLAGKLYTDSFNGGKSLAGQEQEFRDNVFATKYILPFYKTNLGVRDPKIQQALGAAKEIDQFVQMATGKSFINSLSGNFSSAAVAQNLAAASYANFYGSSGQAADIAKSDLKFLRDQMYMRDSNNPLGKDGKINLIPEIGDLRKSGGLGASDLTAVYRDLKQAGIVKGQLSDGGNLKKVAGFGEAITAARNVFGDSTGTTELLQMFEEMHGDLANVNPDQIKSTMTKLTAILDVTQKGAQELIAKTESIRDMAIRYGGYIGAEQGLEITTKSIFREAELRKKGYSGKRAMEVADDEAAITARATVSTASLQLQVLAGMDVDAETLQKIARDSGEFEKLSPELKLAANMAVNDLYGNSRAQESYLSRMSKSQREAADAALRPGLAEAGAGQLNMKLQAGLSNKQAAGLAKALKESDAFTKNLQGDEFNLAIDATVADYVKANKGTEGLLGKTKVIQNLLKSRGTVGYDAFIAAAYADETSTGGPDFAKKLAESVAKAEDDVDAQSFKFWQKDAKGEYVLDKDGNKIEDTKTKEKVQARYTYLMGVMGGDRAGAAKLATAASADNKVREVAAVLKIAEAGGDSGKIADARRWAALTLGEHWGSPVAEDRVTDALSFTMDDIKDATDQAPDRLVKDDQINVDVMKSETEDLEKKAKDRSSGKAVPNMTIPVKLQFGDNGVIEAIARMVSAYRRGGG